MAAEANRLGRSVGPADHEKLDEYFTSVRELEQRLVKNIGGNNSVPPISLAEADMHLKELQQCHKGVTLGHHGLQHHGKNPEKIDLLRLIEPAEMQALADFLTKLKGTPEEGSSVLDKTMVFFGSNLGNASSHDNRNMPVTVAGGCFKHGQHLAFNQKNNGPLPNLFVSMLQRLGIETDTFATGKGTLTGLEAKA